MNNKKKLSPSKGKFSVKKVALTDKIKNKINLNSFNNVTFVHNDGSKVRQPINAAFIKGKNSVQIAADLYALQADKGAKYFVI